MSDSVGSLPPPPAVKRCAILGTASTWRHAPFHEPDVDILALNDAYVLGYPRISAHFDLHPFHQMVFKRPGQAVAPHEVPVGAYLRPEGHLEWLRTRPFPVYLNDAPAEWPTTQTFPRAALEASYGTYVASTPAWILLWALDAGYTDIGIWGIHLATEWEYVQQRPNFEFWIRHAIDRGCRITIPTASTLLRTKAVYAYELKADRHQQAVQRQIDRLKATGVKLRQAQAQAPWYAWASKRDLSARLAMVDAEVLDARTAQRRLAVLEV